MLIKEGEFDVAQINTSEPMVGHEGVRRVKLTYGPAKKPLMFCSSILLSFGIETWPGPPPSHSVGLSFYGKDPTKDFFCGALQAMDQWLLHKAKENLWAWLKCKSLSDTSLCARHYPTVQGGGLKFKLKTTARDTFTTEFYDKTQQSLAPNTAAMTSFLTKGSLVRVFVECASVWISKEGTFGFTWKLHQMIIDNDTQTTQTHKLKQAHVQTTQCMIDD